MASRTQRSMHQGKIAPTTPHKVFALTDLYRPEGVDGTQAKEQTNGMNGHIVNGQTNGVH